VGCGRRRQGLEGDSDGDGLGFGLQSVCTGAGARWELEDVEPSCTRWDRKDARGGG
jgi:hypothetical protein